MLEVMADGAVHSASSLETPIADKLGISVEARSQMLASGGMTILKDRTGWAYYHLFRAGLLDRPSRGRYVITQRGRDALASGAVIDTKFLSMNPEYQAFLSPRAKTPETAQTVSEGAPESVLQRTPVEVIEEAFQALQKQLAFDLLDQILRKPPAFFEMLVIQLLLKMGYGGADQDGRVTGRSGDGGIDGLINEDRLGLDSIYVQAKRWANKVGTPEIRNFVGSLAGEGAHKGIFITTSGFQPGVREYLRGVPQRIVLIDGQRLAEFCIQYEVGVVKESSYDLKRIDATFFEEEVTA